jgi:hypothetical protein
MKVGFTHDAVPLFWFWLISCGWVRNGNGREVRSLMSRAREEVNECTNHIKSKAAA